MSVRSFRATFECAVAAQGVTTASRTAISALRENPGGSDRRPIPPRFLRHSDEQTVVGLAAVLQAMNEEPLRDVCFDEWGVVAAPMFPGRLSGALTFQKYEQGGPAAISPHIIPQNSLHSVSSAISISLAMHGLNFGIGGGPEALAEGLTVAMTLVDHRLLPGLWLVLTQWWPEPVPDGLGSTQTETTCLAVALGLRSVESGQQAGLTLRWTACPEADAMGTQIRVVSQAEERAVAGGTQRSAAPLADLARWLAEGAGRSAAPWSFGLPWGGRVELAQANYLLHAKAA